MAPGFPDPPAGLPWPQGTAWAWRPSAWQAGDIAAGSPVSGDSIGRGLKLFHSGAAGAVEVRAGVPSGLVLGMDAAAGAFVSLVIDLPEAALGPLGPRSIVRLAACGALTGVGTCYGRINLRHGPNVATQTQTAQVADGTLVVAFDLAHTELGPHPVTQVWVDLMVGQPDHAELTLLDLGISLHPRAEL